MYVWPHRVLDHSVSKFDSSVKFAYQVWLTLTEFR